MNAKAGYQAHEWGTFTSLVGSSGITVNGMYHEDEVLPEFVHGFGEVQARHDIVMPPLPNGLRAHLPPALPVHRPCHGKSCFDASFYDTNVITQKMETPVIYFYGDAHKEVEVNVKFPEGLITETFPAPVKTFPIKSQMPVLGNGEATFKIEVVDALTGSIPYAAESNIYSHARKVASNIVKSGSEEEKFIFYRGLGRFQPKISITSIHGNLNLTATQTTRPQEAFLVDVDQSGDAQMLHLGSFLNRTVSADEIARLKTHQSGGSEKIAIALEQALVGSGLNEDEASAMIATWSHGYLHVPGLRLLYILPRAEADQVLPLQMTPAPESFERVFVGRIEIMLDTEEQNILTTIRTQGAAFNAASLGRFGESKLRRVRSLAHDQTTLYLIDGLIEQVAHANQD